MYGGLEKRQIRRGYLGGILALGMLLALPASVWAATAGGHSAHLNWSDFLFRLLNFGIMVAILVKLGKKPLRNLFASRREGIRQMLEELETKRQEAETKCEEYKTKLAALESETQKIVADYIQEGEAEKQKIIEAAERQAEYVKEQASMTIQQEMQAAKDSLQQEIAEASVAAAEELLKKNMQFEDQERSVQDFMTKVVEAK